MKLLSALLLTLSPATYIAAEYQCPLPETAKGFSAIVYGNMNNAAHNVYSGVAVGGAYKNTIKPNQSVVVSGKSYVGSIEASNVNWNGGVVKGATLVDAGIDWSYFEYMAKNTFNTTRNGYKIVRLTSGGTFNTYDFQPGGQGEDNGRTIVFFDTTDQVTLTKTSDSRQFGPTIIAPFSHVEIKGNAGFVDGLIVARSLVTSGGQAGQLQLHGDYFKGNDLPCLSTLTSDPTSAPTVIPAPPSSSPGSNGDPHFKTWKNEHFEYHGQCDMMLLKDPGFADGLGIEVQIRTKLVRHWSYIKSAAIRIGSEILEVEGSADPTAEDFHYWYNFQARAQVNTFAGFPVTFKSREYNNYKSGLEIDLNSVFPGEKIVLATWKEFVRVDFRNPSIEAFGKSVGLLGNFHTGQTLARDGVTILDDFKLFGNEWQVLPTENMLFHIVEQPQFPKACIEPEDPQGDRRRRLDESSVTEELAEAACARIADEMDRKDCIYDVFATQDMGMAGAY